jgi:hypothetical protein
MKGDHLMQPFLEQISRTVGGYLPNLVAAFAILVVGWLVALLISAGVKALLKRTRADNRLAERAGLGTEETPFNIEETVSKIVYYIILLFVLIAFFQALGLTIVTQPLNSLLNQIFAFGPNILAAGALLLIAWLIATALRFIISKALAATKLDDRLGSQVGLEKDARMPLSETLAMVVYWLVFLLFLPAILDALGMQGLLAPVQGMIDELLGYLPNVLGAGLILLVGWFVARIVRQIVTGLLAAIGTDKLGERIGMTPVAGGQPLSGVLGTLVYALILIPTVIASLNALQIEAISGPATTMLTTLLNALPAIFGAAVVLFVAYLIGRLVSGLVASILTGLGFNRVLVWIGLGSEPEEGERTPSQIVGYLVLVGIMVFAVIEAANLVGFTTLSDLAAQFLVFAGQVLLGLLVFGLGLYLANLVRTVILGAAGSNARFLAEAGRWAIVVLSAAMALRQMGIANDIVNLAFGLLLGAIAVAVALAFGLGSRDIAGREIERWVKEMRGSEPHEG